MTELQRPTKAGARASFCLVVLSGPFASHPAAPAPPAPQLERRWLPWTSEQCHGGCCQDTGTGLALGDLQESQGSVGLVGHWGRHETCIINSGQE